MNEIKLKDLYLCAFLLNEGKEITKMEKENDRYWFFFNPNEQTDNLINAYWNNEALTYAKAYVNRIQDLKDRIFSGK